MSYQHIIDSEAAMKRDTGTHRAAAEMLCRHFEGTPEEYERLVKELTGWISEGDMIPESFAAAFENERKDFEELPYFDPNAEHRLTATDLGVGGK